MTLVSKINIDKNWLTKEEKKAQVGLLKLITEVDKRSAALSPKDSRALVNSRKIRKTGMFEYTLSYGSSKVPYARIQELGGWAGRALASHIKGTRYLQGGAESVAQGDFGRFFRSAV